MPREPPPPPPPPTLQHPAVQQQRSACATRPPPRRGQAASRAVATRSPRLLQSRSTSLASRLRSRSRSTAASPSPRWQRSLAAATATGRHELLALVQNHPARLSVGPSVGGDLSIRLRGCGAVPAALRQPLAARVPLGGEGDQATHEGDEALIRKAAKVLKNPRVAGTAVEERLGFLRSKGLSEAQIAAALERAGLAEPRQQPHPPRLGGGASCAAKRPTSGAAEAAAELCRGISGLPVGDEGLAPEGRGRRARLRPLPPVRARRHGRQPKRRRPSRRPSRRRTRPSSVRSTRNCRRGWQLANAHLNSAP